MSFAPRHSLSHAWGGRSSSAQRKQHRTRRLRPAIEALEVRCLLDAAPYYLPNGSGNNIANPTWGEAVTDLLRISPVAYADGVSAPSLPQIQSARAISNILNDQADPNNSFQDFQTVDQNSLSAFGYVWGQFIDH